MGRPTATARPTCPNVNCVSDDNVSSSPVSCRFALLLTAVTPEFEERGRERVIAAAAGLTGPKN